MILVAVGVRAQEPNAPPAVKRQAHSVDQVIYRGVVGNVLETVPLDPERRIELQRANAVVSNTLSGRTLAILLGLTTPVFIIGGLAWGVFAASRIRPAEQMQAASGAGICRDESPASVEVAESEPAAEFRPVSLGSMFLRMSTLLEPAAELAPSHPQNEVAAISN